MSEHSGLYRKIGHLIRRRREEADLTQQGLGTRVRLNRTSISHFESGRQRIQIDKLYEIADALQVEPSSLLPPRDSVRPDAATSKIWRGLRLPREVRGWVAEISASPPPRQALLYPGKEIHEMQSGLATGKRGRKTIEFFVEKSLALLRLKEPPVPVDKLAERLGITLRYGPCAYDAVSFILEQGDRIILGVNSAKPVTRQRFAIAHSIGHLLLRAAPQEFHLDTDFRVDSKPDELEASTFASQLLLPTEWLQRDMPRWSLDFENEAMISELSGRYKVSMQVLTTRLVTLPSFAELSPGKKAWVTKQKNIALKLAAKQDKTAEES